MKLSSLSDFARVVILDDNKDEGNGIKEALETIQIPGLFYHVTSNRVLPKEPFKNIRLVFLDLIFSDSGGRTDAQNAGNALSKLSKIIGSTGFYVLVIWSGHTTDGVARVFEEQLERQGQFARPYKLLALQKTDYRMANGRYNARKIIRKINEQLKLHPSLQIFSDWERLATNSVSGIANTIAGQKSHDDLSRTINSLSYAYGGISKSKDVPKNALMAFNEVFHSYVSKEIVSNDFRGLHRKISPGQMDDLEKVKLNTSLLFTPDKNFGPGTVFKINQTKLVRKKFIASILDQNETALGPVYEKITPIAIEITPLCNAAQKNGKHAYFLNGLIHPLEYAPPTQNEAKKSITIDKNKKPYCYTLEKSFWDDKHQESVRMTFNLKLFHSTISKKYFPIGKKLNDNLVIDLQHQVSAYISRPGHVLL